jgi:hypothetical protein
MNITLFGDVSVKIVPKKNRSKTLFEDYDGFIEKFKPQKTTDDCYTPPEVYDCVLSYVSKKVDISDLAVIRPFYPGGDYESIDYPDRCVVIDNPPFSIISKIARYYIERDIKFFLFAPHLTLFSANLNCTAIVCGAHIIYENGAKVRTSFLSNMFGDIRILGDPMLYEELTQTVMRSHNLKKVKLLKYHYPPNILTVSMVQKLVERGMPIQFDNKDLFHYQALDAQRKYNKSIFGNGFLLSEKAAAEKATAEKATTEKVIKWELSEREMNIVRSLGESSKTEILPSIPVSASRNF